MIVGSDKIFAIENFYVKYLREVGVTVLHFPANSIFSDYYQKSLSNKLLFKVGLSRIYDAINNKLKEIVKIENPEIVWVFKGMEISPETLSYIKFRKIKLVNYNSDNPFLFSGKGSGNKNITDALSLYDLHLTYNLEVKKIIEHKFKIKTLLIPFGFDVDDDLYNSFNEIEEINGVCFLGNPDRERAYFLQSLAEMQIPLTVYGSSWGQFVNQPLIRIERTVTGDEFFQILRKYRVQLNLLRPHNLNSHNMRTFEIPAVGGIQLAPDTPDHRLFFESEKEIFLYRDVSECANQIFKILTLSKSCVKDIRQAARSRSIRSGYSYQDRASQVLSEMQKLLQ